MVRMISAIDSSVNAAGQRFDASVTSPFLPSAGLRSLAVLPL